MLLSYNMEKIELYSASVTGLTKLEEYELYILMVQLK